MKKPAKAPTAQHKAAAAKKHVAAKKRAAKKPVKKAAPTYHQGYVAGYLAGYHTSHKPVPKTPAARKRSAAAKKAAVTRKKKAALGGQCAWVAFGQHKPWYRRGPATLSNVARYAGFEPGPVQVGSVIGVTITYGSKTGYHAARVTQVHIWGVTIDLWGEPYGVFTRDIEESYTKHP